MPAPLKNEIVIRALAGVTERSLDELTVPREGVAFDLALASMDRMGRRLEAVLHLVLRAVESDAFKRGFNLGYSHGIGQPGRSEREDEQVEVGSKEGIFGFNWKWEFDPNDKRPPLRAVLASEVPVSCGHKEHAPSEKNTPVEKDKDYQSDDWAV